jgi:hypothetical protein
VISTYTRLPMIARNIVHQHATGDLEPGLLRF